MMRVTYYALTSMMVGNDIREAGDLVPEARDWPYLTGYVADGKIAPVLVATLPEDVQMVLMEWEESQNPEAIPAEDTKTPSQTKEKV